MGRKAITKSRQNNQEKMEQWAGALFPFFQQHGLKGITIDRMASWLNKSKSTLYQYFSSKEEIILLSLQLKLTSLLPYQRILTDTNFNHVDRYQNFLEFIAEHISDISSLFLADLQEDYQAIWEIIDQFLNQLLRVCEAFYEEAIEAKIFEPRSTKLLLETDRHFIFGLLMNPDFLRENNLTLSELTVQYLELRLNGLLKR